jgi:hypothetical protein
VYVGITGHRSLPDAAMWAWVGREVDAVLTALAPPRGAALAESGLIGVTGLAAGADTVFARAVLAHGGTLHVVLAFPGFERSLEPDARDEYARLLALAETVETLPAGGTDDDAYLAEGRRVVVLSELLVAVWDGEPAHGVGGTGDVVEFALADGTPVVHVDPFHERVTRLGGV